MLAGCRFVAPPCWGGRALPSLVAGHKIIFLCPPPAKTGGGRAACKRRSGTQQISAQGALVPRCCRPPPRMHATLPYHRPRPRATTPPLCALHQPRLVEGPTRGAQGCSKSARKAPRCCRRPAPHATLGLPQRYTNRTGLWQPTTQASHYTQGWPKSHGCTKASTPKRCKKAPPAKVGAGIHCHPPGPCRQTRRHWGTHWGRGSRRSSNFGFWCWPWGPWNPFPETLSCT